MNQNSEELLILKTELAEAEFKLEELEQNKRISRAGLLLVKPTLIRAAHGHGFYINPELQNTSLVPPGAFRLLYRKSKCTKEDRGMIMKDGLDPAHAGRSEIFCNPLWATKQQWLRDVNGKMQLGCEKWKDVVNMNVTYDHAPNSDSTIFLIDATEHQRVGKKIDWGRTRKAPI